MTHAAPVSFQRIDWLDGLRGVAVLLILGYHFVPPPLPDEYGTLQAYVYKASRLGFSGIDLFFVLSGFFIGTILSLREPGPRSLAEFYRRRAMRILPAAWLCITLTLVTLRFGFFPRFTFEDVAASYPPWEFFAFILNWRLATHLSWEPGSPLAHLWSLGVEMQFYLVAPGIFVLFRNALSAGLALVLGGLISRLCLWGIEPRWGFALHFLPFSRGDGFGMGVIASAIVADPRLLGRAACARPWMLAGWMGCGAWLVWLTREGISLQGFALAGFGYSIVGGFYALLIVLLAAGGMPCVREWLRQPWLVTFGLYSYFIYLFQGLAGELVVGLGRIMPAGAGLAVRYLQLPLTITLLLMLAPLSWRWFEKPLLQFNPWKNAAPRDARG